MFTVWSYKLSIFFYCISGGGKLSKLMHCFAIASFIPYLTELFLLDNLLSNSQGTKRIQWNALFSRALIQQSISNGAYFGKMASLNGILWFSNPYPDHPWNFNYLPLENPLFNRHFSQTSSLAICAEAHSSFYLVNVITSEY